MTPFAGAWESQEGAADNARWGTAPRGARWGICFPVKVGDVALVQYAGESQADPFIVGFMRPPGQYGIPWTANQVFGLEPDNEFNKQAPGDDDLLSDRFELTLPTGASVRSTGLGSWAIATPPYDKPRAWVSLDTDGRFKLQLRNSAGQYVARVEFDATKDQPEGRIAVGKTLSDSSYVEFEGQDLIIRAKDHLKIYAQRMTADIAPEQPIPGRRRGGGGLFGALGKLSSIAAAAAPFVPQAQIAGLAAQAAGELIFQGESPLNTLSGLIGGDGAGIVGQVRNAIGGLSLDPDRLISQATQGIFAGDRLPFDLPVAEDLLKTVGLDSITGRLGELTSALDLGDLSMVESLGINSWVGEQVQQLVAGSPIASELFSFVDDWDEVNLAPHELLSEVCRFCGGECLNGLNVDGAIAKLDDFLGDLPGEIQEQIARLREAVDIQALPEQLHSEIQTVSQHLGRYVLAGNRLLGGQVPLFDRDAIADLVGEENIQRVLGVADELEQLLTDSFKPELPQGEPDLDAIVNLPQLIQDNLGFIDGLPAELRSLLDQLPSEVLPHLQDILNFDPAILKNVHQGVLQELGRIPSEVLAELQELPGELLGQLGDLPQEILGNLSEIHPEILKDLAGTPQEILNQLTALPQKFMETLGNLPQIDLNEALGGMLDLNNLGAIVPDFNGMVGGLLDGGLAEQISGLAAPLAGRLLNNPLSLGNSLFKGSPIALGLLGGVGRGRGRWLVRSRSSKSSRHPRQANPLVAYPTRSFHPSTTTTELTRYQPEYGELPTLLSRRHRG